MHDAGATGNEFFKCDFCRRAWAEDLPMVEGHKGSLICAECLETACREVLVLGAGTPHESVSACAMCLLHREETYWAPAGGEGACVCRWCIDRAATMLEKDPDYNWTRPARPA